MRRIRRKPDSVKSGGAKEDEEWSEKERKGNKEWSITSGGAERIRNGGNGKGGKEGRETREGISRAASDGFHVLRSRAELSWLQVGVVGH